MGCLAALFAPRSREPHIRLINAPGITGLAGKTVPTPLKFRRKTLHPAHDRGMGQGQATLGHHLDQIPKAQLEAKIPPHAQDDDLAFKVPPLEQLIKADRRSRHFSNPLPPLDPYYRPLNICTRAFQAHSGSPANVRSSFFSAARHSANRPAENDCGRLTVRRHSGADGGISTYRDFRFWLLLICHMSAR